MASSSSAAAARRRQLALDVAERQPDRDQPLLRAVVEVALEPAALLVAGGDDARARRLDLGQLAAHLHPQPGDLDRQPGGLDHALEQVRALGERASCTTVAELERASPHRRARAAAEPGASTTARPVASTWTSLAGSQKKSSSLGSPSASRQHVAGRLRRRAAGAQILEEALDFAQPLVASAVEAPVDQQPGPASATGRRRARRPAWRPPSGASSPRRAPRPSDSETAAKVAASAAVSVA